MSFDDAADQAFPDSVMIACTLFSNALITEEEISLSFDHIDNWCNMICCDTQHGWCVLLHVFTWIICKYLCMCHQVYLPFIMFINSMYTYFNKSV